MIYYITLFPRFLLVVVLFIVLIAFLPFMLIYLVIICCCCGFRFSPNYNHMSMESINCHRCM